MPQFVELTISQYIDQSGISPSDRAVLNKQYSFKVKKTAEEWYKILKDNFIIPKPSIATVFTNIPSSKK